MPKLTIDIDDDIKEVLNKRAKSNFFSMKEQAEDIIRRSMVSYSKHTTTRPIKSDDPLIDVFSRQKSGRKRKKKK